MLWQKQDGKCYYCGCELRIVRRSNHQKPLPWNAATLDHWIPKSIIPNHVHRYFVLRYQYNPNIVLACFQCNTYKADNLPLNWDGRLGPFIYTQDKEWKWVND